MTNIKSMKKSYHSWKGKIEINGTEYYWEQFTTANPKITLVEITKPVKLNFELITHQNNLGNTIKCFIKKVK